ncbi:MAG: betaine--homocysteine S-methyltransferase [Acidimicrobiia bacterium]|nr:betaine--homocysteine S-methyltransferase [Acidimicrobiia bacterium]
MTTDRCPGLADLLSERDVLVADGAMGTALFDLGLETGGSPELLNVRKPELVARVHADYLAAGADIVLTNTFGGTRARLDLHDLGDRVGELNRAAVEIARAAVDAADRLALVAGSVGPTGELFEPLGPLTHERGVALFIEQVEALVDAGVDIVWVETLWWGVVLRAALEAAAGRGVPVVTTLSFDTNGSTMMGIAPEDLGAWWAGLGDGAPAAIGANCGIGPSDVVQAAAGIAGAAPGAVVVAKGNCGIPLYKDEGLSYPIGPDRMADYAELAVRAGARIVGSCCGSGVAHVAAIRRAVDAGIEGGRPSVDEIGDRLGEVSTRTEPRTRRRRRRAG